MGWPKSPARFEIDEAPLSFRRDDGPVWRLGLEDYRGVGGLATLLSDHADEVLAQAAPDPERRKIVEHLFRALTDINAEGQAIRRPQTFAELVAVTGSDAPTLEAIIDHFRAEGVFFLTPYGDAPIKPGTLIDISHEALIRCWRKIADNEDGLAAARVSRRADLEDAADAGAKGRDPLRCRGDDLGATTWLGTLPSPAWDRALRRWLGGRRKQLMVRSRTAREEEAQRRARKS